MKPINESVQHVLEEMGVENQQSIPDTIQVDGQERPTRNSKGKLIHPTTEGIENFWKWFGDSKVVDGQGKPLVVYRGDEIVRSDFSTGYDNLGIFFTDSKDDATAYGTNITHVYLLLENPYRIGWRDVFTNYDQAVPSNISPWKIGQDGLKAKGHDGVIVVEDEDLHEETGEYEFLYTQFVVFKTAQIKSTTGNSGTFNPSSNKISEGHQ